MNNQTLGDKATAIHNAGYNCAESILRAFRDEAGLTIHDDTLRIATGFGGGLGQAGCLCGALSGAVMVLSLLQGRDSSTQSRDPAYSSVREFHGIFNKQFGATCCRALKSHAFGTKEQRASCLEIVAVTADLLQQYISDKQLVPAAK